MELENLYKGICAGGEWVEGMVSRMGSAYYISNKAGFPYAYEVPAETLCRYTGLTDQCRQKIWLNDIVQYESDVGIVRFGAYEQNVTHYGYYIEWKTDLRKRKDILYWTDKVKVVGNLVTIPQVFGWEDRAINR